MSIDLSHVAPLWPAAIDVVSKTAFTIAARRFIRRPTFPVGFAIFTLFPAAALFGFWVFTLAVRAGPGTHLGFGAGVAVPLLLFWPGATTAVLAYVYALFVDPPKLAAALFALAAARLAWALAYGSSIGAVLTVIDLALALVARHGMKAELRTGAKLKAE